MPVELMDSHVSFSKKLKILGIIGDQVTLEVLSFFFFCVCVTAPAIRMELHSYMLVVKEGKYITHG